MSKAPSGLIVVLEDGVFFAPWRGDPGRTTERKHAKRFKTASECRKAIAWSRKFRPFANARIESA